MSLLICMRQAVGVNSRGKSYWLSKKSSQKCSSVAWPIHMIICFIPQYCSLTLLGLNIHTQIYIYVVQAIIKHTLLRLHGKEHYWLNIIHGILIAVLWSMMATRIASASTTTYPAHSTSTTEGDCSFTSSWWGLCSNWLHCTDTTCGRNSSSRWSLTC